MKGNEGDEDAKGGGRGIDVVVVFLEDCLKKRSKG